MDSESFWIAIEVFVYWTHCRQTHALVG